MKLSNLNNPKFKESSKRITKKIACVQKLIQVLNKRDIPQNIADEINEKIQVLNSSSVSERLFLRLLRKTHSNILRLIEKELKLVPKNYYRDQWMAIGMAVFGISFGVAMGAALGNMAFIGVGIPIGMAIGIGIGTGKDKAAEAAGLVLEV